MRKRIIGLWVASLLVSILGSQAQTTSFTYAGRLDDGGSPASGLYDMVFTLYNAATAGNVIGAPETNAPTSVSNGLFTVTLDFGNQFPGAARWLEVAVRTNGGSSFTTLSPRHAITSTPYAIRALSSASAAQITGVVPLSRLPSVVVTNGATGINIAGTFSGDGAGMTNIASTAIQSDVPRLVSWGDVTDVPPGLDDVISLASGSGNSYVLLSNQRIVGFGSSALPGEAGVLANLTNAVAVAAKGTHALALRANGTVVAWGNNLNSETNVPQGLSQVRSVAAGSSHCLAVRSNGTIVAWGRSAEGQLAIPGGLSDVLAADGGAQHSLALKSNGTVVAWGSTLNAVPAGLDGVKAIAAGANHSLALRTNGTVTAWGRNVEGQATVPPGLSNVVAIAGGGTHSMALRADGTVVVWGGDGVSDVMTVPARIQGYTVMIAAGQRRCLALRAGRQPIAPSSLLEKNVFLAENRFIAPTSFDGQVTASNLAVLGYSSFAGEGVSFVATSFMCSSPTRFLQSVEFDGFADFTEGSCEFGTVLGNLNFFGPGQRIGLGRLNIGIGAQSDSVYFRGGAGAGGGFAWYEGGTHSDTYLDAGSGGRVMMTLNQGGLQMSPPIGQRALSLTGNRAGIFDDAVAIIRNVNTGSSAPALRLTGAGNSLDGILSVSTTSTSSVGAGYLAKFGNAYEFVSTLDQFGRWIGLSFSSISDRAAKENFTAIDPNEVLEKVAALPMARWTYKSAPGVEHIGPVAQDFHAAFGLNGDDDKHITTVDADGVALAAIQGLNKKLERELQAKEERIHALERQLAELKELLTKPR